MSNTKGPLVHYTDDEPDSCDYVLEGNWCWITVKNLSVWVRKQDEGVIIEIYPHGDEARSDTLGQTFVFYDEAKTEEEIMAEEG